jgi:hypothetical protein
MQLTSPKPSQPQWLARPQQPAVTGGPRRSQPTFKGSLPPNATSQFLRDLLGVWVPKMPLTRSKTQFFEDAFLENIENVAFYFAIPLAAPLFGKAINKLHALNLSNTQIGSSWSELPQGAINNTKLIGAKMGTVLAVLSLAAGIEYMIQHAKNAVTARQFETKNFAAVAGLEAGKPITQAGEMDPVTKAKRRTWQVGALMAGTFALAAVMPRMVQRSKAVQAFSEKFLKVLHFGSNKAKDSLFDLTKPMLALLAGIGAVSYIDASRDNLERKETGFRLMLVIPYMLFGKELAGNALAKFFENSKIELEEGGKTVFKKVKDILKEHSSTQTKLSFLNEGSLWQQFKNPETLMDLNKVKGSLAESMEQAAKEGGKKIPLKVKEAIFKKHGMIGIGSYLLSAAVCGIGINWLAYRQTKERYRLQQLQRQQQQQLFAQGRLPVESNSAFSGRPRLQQGVTFSYPQFQQKQTQAQWPHQMQQQAASGFSRWQG